jgi:hypothetical protein
LAKWFKTGLLALAGALLLGGIGGAAQSTSAACAAPSIVPAGSHGGQKVVSLHPGDPLRVKGSGWLPGCNDTGGATSPGCWGAVRAPKAARPYRNVDVFLQGPVTKEVARRYARTGLVSHTDVSVHLGRRDARSDGSFELRTAVPPVPAGRYWILSDQTGSPAPVRILPGPVR